MGQFAVISRRLAILAAFCAGNLQLQALAQEVNQPGTTSVVAPQPAVTVETTTTTTTTTTNSTDTPLRGPVETTSNRFSPAPDNSKARKKEQKEGPVTFNYKKARKSGAGAKRMANYMWLDKAAMSNPEIIESITWHHDAALKLAKHLRLGDIAEGDRYLCRRLTRWKDVAFALAQNMQADRVIARDPEGMYRAIARWPSISKVLAKNPLFNQMVIDVPDLADVMAQHM